MIALHKPHEIDLIMTWDWVLELTHYWITKEGPVALGISKEQATEGDVWSVIAK